MYEEVTKTPSPYRVYSIEDWARFRVDAPMTLSEEEIVGLRTLGDPISIQEVENVYLPISRLLSFYVEATQGVFDATQRFLGTNETKVPFILGISGSVAVGKSTTGRVLRELLTRWSSVPKVDLVTTDGFLFPNAALKAEGRMERKGFPESYDVAAIISFLTDIKAGKPRVTAPVYSHVSYDIVPNQRITVDRPDILIMEGLNVLQPRPLPKDGKVVPFISDFFDFSIYLDADENALKSWYIERFMSLKATAFRDPQSYFHEYADLDDMAAEEIALELWERINLVNLRENILPTRSRANLIIWKDADHRIQKVALRKI